MWAGKGFCFAPIAAHIIALTFNYFGTICYLVLLQ